mgnify:CR=1 FL=1
MPTSDLLEALDPLDPDAERRLVRRMAHVRQQRSLSAAPPLLATLEPIPPHGAEAAPILQSLLRDAARPLGRYRCAACGFEAERYFWQCPGCQGWDTYPTRKLEDL